ncbi:hypothetical protein [Nocardioides bizhenqiangii]|uniref:DUF4367 domain-containing protein n=1 Tax=Nocardioides bizhenqiangii TaxID=3095076 RepID=A0ABZ0ZUE8_9ACTN|nr:hypothetical protein [Nocardioides sp. HM61]WQQ27943.1 hypothetical protein SHK19_06830 [Nocardioides sp. HM61]
MIERELAALADRVAPAPPPDLPDRVLARIGDLDIDGGRSPRRVWGPVAAGVAALVAASFLSPQVRAVAADVLGVAGIEFSSDTPDAPPEPREPLPDSRDSSLAEAQAQVDFRVGVPGELGPPETVTVADRGRVASMTWRGGDLRLDQFDGTLGPVFSKQVGVLATEELDVNGATAWWIDAPHDLTYVDRQGREVTATARLAGTTLVWDGGNGVTFRLEGERLNREDAFAIARSVR